VTRLYIPATLHQLVVLERDGRLRLDVDEVVIAPDDSEDSEYDALMTAAGASALLVRELDPGERRRVVIVAEVAWPAELVVLADVVAVHADAGDLPSTGGPDAPGDPDGLDMDDLDDLGDLGWYATQEIPRLLEG
jgi:hypothetical protein